MQTRPVCSLVFAGVLAAFVGRSLSAQPGGDRARSIKAGESCPPGTTEIRPRSCLGPEEPPPSILDYRPRSTLVVPAHALTKARYPAIDFHGHPQEIGRASCRERVHRCRADERRIGKEQR